jgi:maleate isomerase
MKKRTLLGMLTPSSNTSLEPLTSAMVAGLPGVSAHFARFPVTEISLTGHALGQFDDDKIIQAAMLLADAKVDVIAWNGTSSGWLGFEADERLCRRITDATGIPATTSVLALNEILKKTHAHEFGLVTPYLDDVQQRIVRQYAQLGIDCVAERHLGLRDNASFADVPDTQLAALMRKTAQARPDAVATFCTNLHAAHLAGPFEQATGIAAYDTVSTVVWKALRMAGVDTGVLARWGKLFSMS